MQAGVLLLCWLLAVLLAQQLPVPGLLALALLLLLSAMFGARQRCLQLLRRIRILALAIVILFAWFTPGEALWLPLMSLAPSREGVLLALQHLARLCVVVCALALLLEKLPLPRLLSGLYSLSGPFVLFGLSPARFALRLMLVLRLLEDAESADKGAAGQAGRRPARSDWQSWLAPVAPLAPGADELYVIELEPLLWRDRCVLGLLGLILLWWSLW